MCLEDELKSVFNGIFSLVRPHLVESENIVAGFRLVCVEDPEVFSSILVLLGLDKSIPKLITALHFVSQCDPPRSGKTPLDIVLSLRDWMDVATPIEGYPSVTQNAVRASQVIMRSLCIAVSSGCLDDLVPLEDKIILYNELTSENEETTVWNFLKNEELREKAANWLAEHTTSELKMWHQVLRSKFM